MPTRARRDAEPEPVLDTAPPTEATQPPPPTPAAPDRPQAPARRNGRGPKVVKGELIGDPELRFTSGGKSVAKLRVAELGSDGSRGNTTWTATVWEDRAERAAETLRQGDRIKVIGQWDDDREYDRADGTGKAKLTHQLTARDIGVMLDDRRTVPLDNFDRSALDTSSVADAGGMSAAD